MKVTPAGDGTRVGTVAHIAVPKVFAPYVKQLRSGQLLSIEQTSALLEELGRRRDGKKPVYDMAVRRAVRNELRLAAIEGQIPHAAQASTIWNATPKEVIALVAEKGTPSTKQALEAERAHLTKTLAAVQAEATGLSALPKRTAAQERQLTLRTAECDTIANELSVLGALEQGMHAAKRVGGAGFVCRVTTIGGIPQVANGHAGGGVAVGATRPGGRQVGDPRFDGFVQAGASAGVGLSGMQGLRKNADGKRTRARMASAGPVQLGDPYLGPKFTPAVLTPLGVAGVVLTPSGVGASAEVFLGWLIPSLGPLARVRFEVVLTHPLMQPLSALTEREFLKLSERMQQGLQVPGLPEEAARVLPGDAYRDLTNEKWAELKQKAHSALVGTMRAPLPLPVSGLNGSPELGWQAAVDETPKKRRR